MVSESSPPPPNRPRVRWYELEAEGAAFLTGMALAVLALRALWAARVGESPAWDLALTAAIVLPAMRWGRRLSRRVLVPAMIVLWVVALAA